MNTGRGVFIAIEGTDGSGKGTQFQLLSERLAQEGYDVATFDFPQYELPSSHFVREYLNGRYGSVNEVGPYTASLFYALDRYEAAPHIRKALDEGKVVITNRFVGSSMAHQGTKFRNAEERRGYFIWLDNLEFEMLNIPRPTVSFVLRVSASVAQQLVDKKTGRTYTAQKRDIHEADLQHLERSVSVYDDMCQLFPKDFVRIDCTRDEKLLEMQTIQNILWQKIEPMLPAKRNKKGEKGTVVPAEVSLPTPVTTTKDASDIPSNAAAEPAAAEQPKQSASTPITAHLAGLHLPMREVSLLAAKKLEWSRLGSYMEIPGHLIAYDQKNSKGEYRYHIPHYLDEKVKNQYCAHLDQIFNLHAEIVAGLAKHLEENSDATQEARTDEWRQSVHAQAAAIARSVLPAAATTTVAVYGSAQAVESIVTGMLSDNLPEAYENGKELLAQARSQSASFMEHADLAGDVTYRTSAAKKIRSLAEQHLTDNYAASTKNVQLTDVWPRNEFDLISDMLYEQSSLPLATIREAVASWPYQQKAAVIEAYVGDRSHRDQRPGRALEKAHYSWDLLCDFDSFRDLQRHRMVDGMVWQDLTPRYGYEMPQIIEDADLMDQFESCFELSLRLHGLLQAAGYDVEAQYATLLGHKLRWKITYNAREAFHLHELRSGAHNKPGVQTIVREMHAKLAEKHPMLGEAMRFVNSGEA